jgi:hypothetical protein
MTDDPTIEEAMTQALNTAKLREVTATATNRQESREVEIHTRAEQRLQLDTDRASELDGEIADDEDYALRLRNQMVEMQRLLTQTEANILKRKAEREACLESAHTLRKAGIALP